MLNPPLPASTPFHRPHTSAAPATLQQSLRRICAGRLLRVLHHASAREFAVDAVFFTFVSNALERARHPELRLYSLTLSLIDEINVSVPRRKYHNLSHRALLSV